MYQDVSSRYDLATNLAVIVRDFTVIFLCADDQCYVLCGEIFSFLEQHSLIQAKKCHRPEGILRVSGFPVRNAKPTQPAEQNRRMTIANGTILVGQRTLE
ncbi:hypothetical protein J6590_028921, partial [Homalodisca vitripennis]